MQWADIQEELNSLLSGLSSHEDIQQIRTYHNQLHQLITSWFEEPTLSGAFVNYLNKRTLEYLQKQWCELAVLPELAEVFLTHYKSNL